MFRVLFVCTGNICRSPMAEHLMRQGLQDRLGPGAEDFEVASAGTYGFVGEPMEPFALEVLRDQHGIDGSAFRARALSAELVAAADLVLTASREHRAAAVTLQPQAGRRTFTVRELDRLLSVVDPAELPQGDRAARASAAVVAAVSQRGLVRPERPADDDVTDPYRGPRGGFETCGRLLDEALRRPLDLLAG